MITVEEFFDNLKIIPFEISEDIAEDEYGETEKQVEYNAIITIPESLNWEEAVSSLRELDKLDLLKDKLIIHAKHCIRDLGIGFNKEQRHAVVEFVHAMDKYEWRKHNGD
jgi:hypothetical protein